MINKFKAWGRDMFELSGSQYEITEPTDHFELSQAFGTMDAIQNAINLATDEEDRITLQHLYDRQEELVKAYCEKYGEFKNTVLVNNINYLAKQWGLKIGYIERFLGISPGYISRTAKEGSGKRMSIDTVWKLSKFFNRNIDDFVNRLLGREGRDKDMIDQFIHQLIEMTRDGSMNWDFMGRENDEIPEKFMDAGLIEEIEEDRYLYLPAESNTGIGRNRHWEAKQPAVLSAFSNGKDLVIFPYDLYEEGNYMRDYDYMLLWQEEGDWKHEIMFSTGNAATDDLEELTGNLFMEIRTAMSEMRVTPEVRTIISGFINEEKYPWDGNA